MAEKLYEKLLQLGNSDLYPFHMPGHKRNVEKMPDWNMFAMDITEIDGFDNLHDAENLLKETMDEIAAFRGAAESHLLINGSTSGLLSAICGCTNRGDEILVARNCHKSVYHAMYLNELCAHYIYPHFSHILGINGGIWAREIEKMLITFPNIRTLVLTSPTYEGILSDISEIVKVAHKRNVPVIVDQAHGAHLGMGEHFPQSAISQGADIVIESVHKTLPSLTQSALLHIQGDLVNVQKIQKFLSIYQTSSPSYPMMAGIAWCMDYCRKEDKKEFVNYEHRLLKYREMISKLPMIELFDGTSQGNPMGADYDFGKLVIGVKNQRISGSKLYDILREKYHLQMEMASLRYVIAMTSVMDTEEGFERLYQALKEINDTILKEEQGAEESILPVKMPPVNEETLSIFKAEEKPKEWCLLDECIGKIAGEYLYLYPPGIPLVVPGEVISRELIGYVRECEKSGLQVKGLRNGQFCVICEEKGTYK